MKRYKEIKLETGIKAATSTIQGIKKLCQKGKLNPQRFTCLCPNGNIHIWEIVHDRTHTCCGSAPRKKAARIGKGVSKYHYQATLKQVKHV